MEEEEEEEEEYARDTQKGHQSSRGSGHGRWPVL
jgi:hypothetical protein